MITAGLAAPFNGYKVYQVKTVDKLPPHTTYTTTYIRAIENHSLSKLLAKRWKTAGDWSYWPKLLTQEYLKVKRCKYQPSLDWRFAGKDMVSFRLRYWWNVGSPLCAWGLLGFAVEAQATPDPDFSTVKSLAKSGSTCWRGIGRQGWRCLLAATDRG